MQHTESLETRQLLSANPLMEISQLSDEFEDQNSIADWSRLHQTEGWNADQLQAWDVNQTQSGRMAMVPETAVWYQDWRGPMAFKEVTGDFVFTTEVHITDRDDVGGSDSDNVPGDALFSLGGLMIRTPREIDGPGDWSPGSMQDDGTNNGENYVFLSLGYGNSANEFSLEVKTTRNSNSQLELSPLGADADTVRIQIARVGDTVLTLFQEAGQQWQVHRRYSRPDMPQTIQAGLVTYTDWEKANDFTPLFHNSNVLTPSGTDPTPDQPFNPDLVAGFEYARFARPQVPAGLTTDDLLNHASDEQLLSFLGDNAHPAGNGEGPIDPAVPGATSEMSIGMNLTMVNDWTHSWIFKDAFKLARTFTTRSLNTTTWEFAYNGPPEMDGDGWVTSLPADMINENGETTVYWADSILFSEGGNPAGTYRAEWNGEGSITFGATVLTEGVNEDGRRYAVLDVAEDQTLHIRINDTNPDNHIRDIQIFMPDYEGQSLDIDNWNPGSNESPFHPLYLERLQPFDTIRFMQWQQVNSDNRAVLTAADLRPVTHANQGSTSRSSYNGVSVEYMVQLANELGSNVWFNMPHQADDSYVQAFAEYVRDNIHDNALIHVEYSNEVWNYAPGYTANAWVAGQMSLPENEGLTFIDVWAQEARRDFTIWSGVFAGQEDQLIRVAAGQQNNPWLTGQLLERMNGEFDAVSSTSYAGFGNRSTDWINDTMTQDDIIDQVLDTSVVRSLQTQAAHVDLAEQYSQQLGRDIQFLTYEGGSHLDAFGSEFEELVHSVQDHPRFREIYATLLNGMQDLGVEMHTQYVFSSTGRPTPHGEFGVLHEMAAPLEDAHEYHALVDFIGGNLDRPLSIIAIEATDAAAHESGDSAEFTITRHGGLTTSDQIVTYTIGGTAEPGLDYEALSGTAVIAAGATSTTVIITPVLDSNVSGDEGTEQIRLTLDDSIDYALAENSTATAALMDNEFLTIGDRSISRNDVLTVDLPATNPAGAAIDYEVLIGGDLLFTLNRQYNLTSTGNYHTDHTGAMEKWVRGTSVSGTQEWFFILPNGDFGQATGGFADGLVANVGTDAYHDPRLLLEAPAPASGLIHNGVLTITPATGFAGVFEVTLNQGIGNITSSTTFQVTVTNSTPVLAPIADRSHAVSDGPITIPLLATDADNDSLTFTVRFSGSGQQAAQLNGQFNLTVASNLNNYGLNWGGRSEKWINGIESNISNGWYFLLPDGSVNAWGGSFETSTQIAVLSTAHYDDPELLLEAEPPGLGVEVVNSNLIITPSSETGTFAIEVTGHDGVASASTDFTFTLTNNAPELSISDQIATDGVPLSIQLPVLDADGQEIFYTVELLGDDFSLLDAEHGFYSDGNYWTNYLGQNERWIRDSDHQWFYLLPGGELHQWNDSFDNSPLIATLSADVYEDPTLLTAPTTIPVTFSVTGGVLTIQAESGYSGTLRMRVTANDGFDVTSIDFRVVVSSSANNNTDTIFANLEFYEL